MRRSLRVPGQTPSPGFPLLFPVVLRARAYTLLVVESLWLESERRRKKPGSCEREGATDRTKCWWWGGGASKLANVTVAMDLARLGHSACHRAAAPVRAQRPVA